jgi:hypothetical protein
MNIHEKIADERRMQLRKSMVHISQWANQASTIPYADTKKILASFMAEVEAMVTTINEIDKKQE